MHEKNRNLRWRRIALRAMIGAATLWSAFASAQPAQPNDSTPKDAQATTAPGVEDRGWPRLFESADHTVVVNQPQIESWPDFDRITFRAAIVVRAKPDGGSTYGVLRASAQTTIAFEERLVVLSERKIESLDFPDVPEAKCKELREAVIAAAPPAQPQTISLDRLIAAMDASQLDVKKVSVSLAPPPIFSSQKRGVLVVFMGKPRFKPAPGDGSLMYAINTNWDVFLDTPGSTYYLRDGQSWLATQDLEKGQWAPAKSLPKALSSLPADEQWDDVRAAIPGSPANDVPAVFVSREPAELLVVQGEPELEPIPGTSLMLVANTENDLVYNSSDKQFYLLTAGRWFKAPKVAGPWNPASDSLPADFAKIPEDSDAGDLLVAVPGTPAATEAAIMASVPQRATVNKAEVTVNVVYDGSPNFRPIESTTVKYAHNTPYDVFLVEGKYYCCYNAVWFIAPSPTGVWTVCDAVPKALYTIPPTHPAHNVTYVRVYESTPTTVVTGYTAGYSGATVAATGVVMFGLGVLVGKAIDDDDCCWSYHYHSGCFSYGCGARWVDGFGGYVAAGHVYGPYGGAGSWARYNPATGVYARGGYIYGPSRAAGYRSAYNPATGVAAGRVGGVTPYGSWGRAAVSDGDDWVRAGQRSGPRGEVKGVQGSGGAGAVRAENRWGNGVTVAKDRDGDVYVGKDGNLYKRSGESWQQARNSSASNSAPDKQTPSGQRPAAPATTSARTPPSNAGDLQREAAARERGNRNASRTERFKRGESRRTPSRGGRRR